ncbi:hypothetical protein AVEN_144664-1 [Araneus ventricosus]|uniref:Uncharacterized protein n=1 Tax=Araneus ventricosus TaxID=182803 RepID=A0A4Y2DZH1_ARAVE|nr:hypothetical protein AVEN_144664-1 [Araneus ventricosus]
MGWGQAALDDISRRHNLSNETKNVEIGRVVEDSELGEARRKGVDGFSVETAGSGKHPFLPSSDSLTDAWAPTVHKLYHNQAFYGLCDAHSSFAYRQFNSNFTCGDPPILPYELIHTVGHNLRLPRAWQVLDVYASRLITLIPLEYGAPCETLLSVLLFHPVINL